MRPLLDFIAGPESGGRYDIAYGGTKMPPGMTIGQVLEWQRRHGQKTGSSAVGRYQFINKTLSGLVDELGIDPDTPFTPELQDRLATQLLRRRGLDDYQAGKISPEGFAKNLSMEWAGLPSGAHGRSYYAGDKMGNAAGVGWDELLGAIRGQPTSLVDPRMASSAPMGGVPPTDPNMLPDRGSAMTPVATPGFNPNDPYGHMIGAKHPMFDQVMGQQREPSIWDMMTAFGAAGLNSQGGNWFGAGAKAVNDLMQESPGALTGLEALQANNELFELDERRRQAQMERRQQQRRNDALRQIAEDPNQPEWRRQQAQDAVMGLDGVFEAPKQPEAPTKIREAEILSQRLGIPFEEAAARVGLQAPATEASQDPTKVREAEILSERLGIPFEEAATRVGLQAPPAPETGLPAGINHSDITAVRKEFAATPEVREYNAAASQYGSLVNVLEDIDNPAANVAAIFNFMKSLDPTSVVRESEQGMVASASGPMRAFASMVNKSLSKGALTAKDRADIVEAARAALLSRHERVLKVYDRYGRIAREQFRMEDPYLVIGEQPAEPEVPMYASDMPPVEPEPVRPPSPGWGAAR